MNNGQDRPFTRGGVETLRVDRLPPPDAAAQAHSQRLETAIHREIDEQGGSISFARFMELALYAPGLGYYSAGAQKFGSAGDFITAPEISALFGRCLARQFAQVLRALGGGDILEVGAGTGRLAADVLSELAAVDCLPGRYYILETSADLRERQRRMLDEHATSWLDLVHWLDALPVDGFHGVVAANEVLDAMPVHRFRRTADDIGELRVGWEDGHFEWRVQQPGNHLVTERVTAIEQQSRRKLPDGFESEINLVADAWIHSVADTLAAGVVFIIDYGYSRAEYYLPERSGGTLMCHYRHRVHSDALVLVGLQDITSHVDFTTVAEAAVAAGLDVAGYTTQGYFLLASGITELAATVSSTELEQLKIAQQIKRLTLPGEMGEIFKVIALGKAFDVSLDGFSLRDLRGKL